MAQCELDLSPVDRAKENWEAASARLRSLRVVAPRAGRLGLGKARVIAPQLRLEFPEKE